MKKTTMIFVVTIVTLVTTNAYLYVSLKVSEADNKTLQMAVMNPKEVRMPVVHTVQKAPQVIVRTVTIEKDPGGAEKTVVNEEIKDLGVSVDTTYDGGYVREPALPAKPAPAERRFELLGAYNLDGSYIAGMAWQPLTRFPVSVGLGYHTGGGPLAWMTLRF